MRLNITHTPGQQPQITNAETGEPLQGVAALSWIVDANREPRVRVEMVLHDVEIGVEADSSDPETGFHVYNMRHG